jgi:glyoxylate/succinic semialdehyde reductase
VDADTSRKIGAAIAAKGGRFLEAPVSGSKKPAIGARATRTSTFCVALACHPSPHPPLTRCRPAARPDGQLVILAAGDAALYAEAAAAFGVMGKKSFYLGDAGAGAHMKLVVNMVMGGMMAAFSEGMALAEASGLKQSDLLEVLDLGAIANPMFKMKGPAISGRAFPPAFPLKHQQKDMRLALALGACAAGGARSWVPRLRACVDRKLAHIAPLRAGDELNQPLPVAAAANEAYKRAKAAGLGDADFAAVYEAINPRK